MIQAALVGCGRWGRHLARNLHALGALGGVVEPQPAARAGLPPVPLWEWEALLAAAELPAVVLACPAALHAPLALAALQAGKHVYIEKPMALTAAEAQAVAQAADTAGRIVMVGHLLHYHAGFRGLQALAGQGRVGRLRHITALRLAPGVVRSCESVFLDLMAHDISMLLSLAGEAPRALSASAVSQLTPGVADAATAWLEFPGGLTAQLSASWMHPVKQHQFSAMGEAGMLVFDDVQDWAQKLCFYPHRSSRGGGPAQLHPAAGEYVPLTPEEPLKAELAHFLECAQANRPPRTDAREGLAVMRVAEALQSLAGQPWQPFP